MQIKTTVKYHYTCIRMSKTDLNKFKKIQVIQSIPSDLSGIKLSVTKDPWKIPKYLVTQ